MTKHLLPTRFLATSLLLLVAACGGEADVPEGDDGREATGEVLEGTISDAMLPLDEVRSQAPLREAEPQDAGNSTASEAGAPEVSESPAEDTTSSSEEDAEIDSTE